MIKRYLETPRLEFNTPIAHVLSTQNSLVTLELTQLEDKNSEIEEHWKPNLRKNVSFFYPKTICGFR